MKQTHSCVTPQEHHRNLRDVNKRRHEIGTQNRIINFKSIFLRRLRDRSRLLVHAKKTGLEKKDNVKTRSLSLKKSPPALNVFPPEPRHDHVVYNGSIISRLEEAERGVVAQAQATGAPMDEINKLIKKMTLSFSVTKKESTFLLKDGLFAGTSFQMICNDNDLTLNVRKASPTACDILTRHQDYLQQRLHKNEINLRAISFF